MAQRRSVDAAPPAGRPASISRLPERTRFTATTACHHRSMAMVSSIMLTSSKMLQVCDLAGALLRARGAFAAQNGAAPLRLAAANPWKFQPRGECNALAQPHAPSAPLEPCNSSC